MPGGPKGSAGGQARKRCGRIFRPRQTQPAVPTVIVGRDTDYATPNHKLVILVGAMGKTNLDPNGVKALASLPSLDELRGKLIGLIQAPASKIAAVVQAPAGQLARVFGAYAKKDEAA